MLIASINSPTGLENESSLDKEFINNHLSKLSENCQELIRLYYFMKVRLKDVAGMLGYSENFIKIKHKRCLDEFREKLNAQKPIHRE